MIFSTDTVPSVAVCAVEGLAYHFDAPYSYLIPPVLSDGVKPGCRVLIPFGNGNRKKQGVVLSVEKLTQTTGSIKLKSVAAVLDETPLFGSEMISLIYWLKNNTFCTLFEASKAILPSGIGLSLVISYILNEEADSKEVDKLIGDGKAVYDYLKGKCSFVKRDKIFEDCSLPKDSNITEVLAKKGILISNVDIKRKTSDLTVKNVRLSLSEEEYNAILPELSLKQRNVIKLLLDIGCASVKEICYFSGVTPVVVNTLCKKGLLEVFNTEIYRRPHIPQSENRKMPDLTNEQQNAYLYLYNKYKEGKASAALLYGVTGSGKTSVFIKLIEDVIKDNKGVIVMVPEISLTPQTINLFYSYFGEKIAVFHSGLSAGERIDEWKRVKNGEAVIAIGTRSAVFAPFDNLGLIVIDEEHEHTYKSEMSPRYHARDVAKFRCVNSNALLVLSSATPSLETYKNALSGRYGFVKLPQRYGNANLPVTEIVDMSETSGILSTKLYKEISEALSKKEQAILLINRRGFNTFASCSNCKTVLTCPNCSISLTYHQANSRLMCHYCGYSREYTVVCPECNSPSVRYAGYGTQKIEDELEKMFPTAKILRMDADTTMSKNAYNEKLSAFSRGDYDIMLGTQMVAKGLDFPRVTLVGVISVDQQLYNDDFRSSEKAFDLLTQVIGRSGRGQYKGKAVIQTLLPDNEIITLSATQDYEAFYNTESVIRKSMVYPPYCDICSVMFTSESYGKSLSGAVSFTEELKQLAKGDYSDVKITALGPIQPRVSKISNKYRHLLTIKCKNNKRFREMVSELLISFMKNTNNSGITVVADINPL